jgi:hypothetical protein
MLPAPRQSNAPAAVAGAGALDRTTVRSDHLDQTGVTSMFRLQILAASDSAEEERSMRVVEWILALVAMIVAGVLAFIR